MKLLVIEDDKEIRGLIRDFFTARGWETAGAPDGLEGLRLARSWGADLVILDLMLPYKSGDSLLAELRRESAVPVLVLSARQTTLNKVELLRAGADDYMTKPFDLEELQARAEAILKRTAGTGRSGRGPLRLGGLTIDEEGAAVSVGGEPVVLTAKEYQLLVLLARSPRRVFSKQNLYEAVWREPYAYDEHTVNTHMSNLRKKLRAAAGEELIETVWGLGYKMRER